ncbi:MAG: glycosyltransferase family 2 protein [Chitinophagaceae bacterium]
MKIAVLLATYNRKDKTLSCLENLLKQENLADTHLEIFLTDDASSDGTAVAVKTSFPSVNIFNGTGSLFWAGGMRNSWKKALGSDPDYFLLLNDDTILTKTAIADLLKYSSMDITYTTPAICIGSTADWYTGEISYGGKKLRSKKNTKSDVVFSKTQYVECDLGNANIMLVPNSVVKKIGMLSDAFTHVLADYDYTLRAKKAGFKVMVAPGILGNCQDDHGKNWKSTNVSLKERIRYLKSPKGLAYSEYLGFIKEHFPRYLPEAFFKLWMKTLFPFVWDTLKK